MADQLYSAKNIARCVIPSAAGIFLFIFPIETESSYSFPAAVLSNFVSRHLGDAVVPALAALIFVGVALTIRITYFQRYNFRFQFFKEHFQVSTPWVLIRLLSAFITFMCLTRVGPEIFHSPETGGFILYELLPSVCILWIFASLVLPLLLKFGLLEFTGTLLTRVMRPLFRLPGRSAIDCLTSWLGDGSVGLILTNKQYEDRIYTQREAVTIATTFSAVSITFCMVVITQVNLQHLFLPFYATVCIIGAVNAIILCRLPPLTDYKDNYIDGSPRDPNAHGIDFEQSLLRQAVQRALEKASKSPSVGGILKEGFHNIASMLFSVLPSIVAIGTLGMILAKHTYFFDYLGFPFLPILEFLNIPNAGEAARTLVVGFSDMLLPSIMASSIESEMTRFLVAVISVSQLIYMSEVGALILSSRIPISFGGLFVVFLMRTFISLPIAAGVAHWIF